MIGSSNLNTSPLAYPVATALNISKTSDLCMVIAWSSFILTYTPSQVQYILLCFSDLIHLFRDSSWDSKDLIRAISQMIFELVSQNN